MSVRSPFRTARLRVPGSTTEYELKLIDGSITVDDGWSPRTQASIVIAKPSPLVLAQLNPALSTSRVQLTLSANPGFGVSRFVWLKVTAMQEDAGSGTIGLNLQSDEALLQDYGLVSNAPDRAYWANQASVRSIVYNVLNRALGPGNFYLNFQPLDAAFFTYSPVVNLIPNGTFENGTTAPWFALNAVLGTSTGFKSTGSYSLLVNPNTSASDSFAETSVPVDAGKTYTASAWIGVPGVQPGIPDARARRIWVYGYQDGQVIVLGQSAQAPNTGGSRRLSVTFTVPLNMELVGVRLYSGAANGTNAGTYYDDVMMVEGDGKDTNGVSVIPYFDGSTYASSSYRYEWTGDTNASPSRRVPIIDRPADALTWNPGQSAWDFLTPILQAVGLRLFADFNSIRSFSVKRVEDPSDSGGLVSIAAGQNLQGLTDLLSRTASQSDGTPLFADAVLVHYTWTDSATGESHEAWDSAGPAQPQKTHTVERPDTAYPGPGAAEYIRQRLAQRRRQVEVQATEDYAVVPGLDIAITYPSGEVVTGSIDAVTWDLTSSQMSVKTKNVLSIPTAAIGRAIGAVNIGSVSANLANYNPS